MYDQSFKDIKVEKKKNLLWISLNRPDFSNAISLTMIEELCSLLSHADFDPDVRVIILTGEGKTFCAGGDIKDMKDKQGMFAGEPNELRLNYQKGIQRIPITIEALQTPIIAMVNGPAIGAGCDLACMCDLRFGNEYAKFGETFSKLNLVPGDGGTFFLPRVVGYPKALEMFLTGSLVEPDKAKAIGLLNDLYSADDLRDEVEYVAQKIASNGPIAVQMTKKALKASRNADLQTQLDLLAAFQGITQRTEDHFIGLDSLKNKEPATFKGK